MLSESAKMQCGCVCHERNVAFYLATNPPQPCCKCHIEAITGIPNKNYQIDENKLIRKRVDEIEVLTAEIREKFASFLQYHHYYASRIDDLEKAVKPLSKYISDCDNQRFDSDEILRARIEKLESMIDFKNIENLIFNGAETHASILQCVADIKKLEQSREEHSRSNKDIFERIDKIENKIPVVLSPVINQLLKDVKDLQLNPQTEPYADKPKNDAHSGCQTPVDDEYFIKCNECHILLCIYRGTVQKHFDGWVAYCKNCM